MNVDRLGRVVARLVANSVAHNTLNLPPAIPVHFQGSPDFPQGDVRGINGLQFQVVSEGSVIQVGTTGQDGRIDVRVPPGGTSTIQLLHNAAVVAEYEIKVDPAPLAGVGTIPGQQERLRMLGYQIGHTGADANGVDGNQSLVFERSVLDFQTDQGLLANANAGPPTGPQLTARAGA